MFDKFGEFDSFEEINRAANAQLAEGDHEAIKAIAKENGIEEEYADDFIDGIIGELCTRATAAVGKLDVEEQELKLEGILKDFKNEIINVLIDNEALQTQIRKKDKRLEDVIARYIDKGWENSVEVPASALKKCSDKGIKRAVGSHPLKIGIPSKTERRDIFLKYYMEG